MYKQELIVIPNKPKKLCTYPGCNTLVDGSESRCAVHKTEHNKYKKNKNEWATWYSTTRWRKARQQYLALHPLCVECLKDNRLITAEVVDHIVDHKGNHELFWDMNNWQALCIRHHNSKTARTNLNK